MLKEQRAILLTLLCSYLSFGVPHVDKESKLQFSIQGQPYEGFGVSLLHKSKSKFNNIIMIKKSNTYHPINVSANFSKTVKNATMILQIDDAQRHESNYRY